MVQFLLARIQFSSRFAITSFLVADDDGVHDATRYERE